MHTGNLGKQSEFMDFEIIQVASNNLRHQGIRSYLTLLGIVIGIAAIVALISIGQGLNQSVRSEFESLGVNTVFVFPGNISQTGESATVGSSINITDSDVRNIENILGVEEVVPIYSTYSVVEFSGQKVSTSILAADPGKFRALESTGFIDVKEGRTFQKGDVYSVVVGETFAENAFDKEIKVRNVLEIGGKSYRVVGIQSGQGQSIGGGPNPSDLILMTEKGVKEATSVENPSILFVKTLKEDEVEKVKDDVEEYLEDRYGEKSFQVLSAQQALESFEAILSVVTIFLIGIAAISLLVGGIGIMNAQLMTVIERTKEIGVMKAIGATNSKVLGIFLAESAMIGLIGGAIGTVIGFGLSLLISFAAQSSGIMLEAAISPELVIGVLAFSVIVGMLSGYYPAQRAAKMDPVVALRYE